MLQGEAKLIPVDGSEGLGFHFNVKTIIWLSIGKKGVIQLNGLKQRDTKVPVPHPNYVETWSWMSWLRNFN